MMIVEIESYKGNLLFYGKKIRKCELRAQIKEIEMVCDKNEDNFIELFCRRFGWILFETDDRPDIVYDRDSGRLY